MLTIVFQILKIFLGILIVYIVTFYYFRDAAFKIDDKLGIKVHSYTIEWIDSWFGSSKGNIDGFIDGVGSNEKNRINEYQNSVNDIRGQ